MSIHDQRQKKSLHKTVRFAWTALLLFAGNGYVSREYYLNRITPAIDGARLARKMGRTRKHLSGPGRLLVGYRHHAFSLPGPKT